MALVKIVSLGVSICLEIVSVETLNLDMVLKSVSTVYKFLTVSIEKVSIEKVSIEKVSIEKVSIILTRISKSLESWEVVDCFKKSVSPVDKFSISIGLDSRVHKAYKIDISSFYGETTQST